MPTLPSRELEIARRLRQWRRSWLIGLTALGKAIEEGKERMATYESGRVALRWEVFAKLWRKFSLSPRWLATGEGPRMLAFTGIGDALSPVDSRALFSEVYDSTIAPFLAGAEMGQVSAVALLSALDDESYQSIGPGKTIPAGAHPATASMEIVLRGGGETALDDVAPMPHFSGVSNLPIDVDDLLDRVRSATAEPGAKKALAEWMEVEQQQLSRWLSPSGKRPSTDNALALLHWLTGAKAKPKKTPPEVRTQTARKAKAKHQRESKQSSGPPRK